MPVIIRCSCGKKVRIQDQYLGHRVRCPACGAIHKEPAPLADDVPLAAPIHLPAAEVHEDVIEMHAHEPAPVAAPVPDVEDDFAGLLGDEPVAEPIVVEEVEEVQVLEEEAVTLADDDVDIAALLEDLDAPPPPPKKKNKRG